MLNKRWDLKKQGNEEVIEHLMDKINVNQHIANLLAQRGIDSYDKAKHFFRPSLKDLHDPFLMKDMDKAVDRVLLAIEKKEKILIYGDYDVDGTTAVATVYLFLKRYNILLDYYIPDRYTEGYGISTQGIDYAAENNIPLIIALDCGIKAMEKIEYAKSKNVEFIICDHHRPANKIPDAVAVLDPKRKDCDYPFDGLSGCGVGFKLIQGIAQKTKIDINELIPLLDKVVLSIAADIVPVTGENRILAHFGLKFFNSNPSIGIEAILKTAGIKRRPDSIYKTDYSFTKKISISDLVFIVGPRVNAAGRIKSGKNSVDLLVCETVKKADTIAAQISTFNEERKGLDQNATQEALSCIANSEVEQSKLTTVLFDPTWHKGILGIVASRLTEHYYKPSIVFTQAIDTDLITGSARSIRFFDIYEAIDSCSDLLEHWGGHTYAAGLSLKEENLEIFKERFEKFAQEHMTEEIMTPIIEVDAFLEFKSITKNFHKILRQFAPFGPGNMAPVFQTNEVYDNGNSKIVGKKHLKLTVTQKLYKGEHPGIAFQMANYFSLITEQKAFDIVYAIEENEWNGHTSIQLNVKDIRTNKDNLSNEN